MPRDIKESDWKRFRVVHEEAVNRFCQRVLLELKTEIDRPGKSYHERYGTIYGLIHDRDKEMARMFDDMKRSNAVLQLMALRQDELVTDDEFASFSPELQTRINEMLAIYMRS